MDFPTQQDENMVDLLWMNSMASLKKNVFEEYSRVSEPVKSGLVYP